MADDLAALIDTLSLDPSGKPPPVKPRKLKAQKRDFNAKVPRGAQLTPKRKPLGTRAYDAARSGLTSIGVPRYNTDQLLDTVEFATGFGEMTDAVDRGLSGDAQDGDAGVIALNVALGGLGGLAGKPLKALAGRAAESRLGQRLLKSEPMVEPRPAYERVSEGDHLVVRRKDLKPETVPEAKDARSLDQLRVLVNDYSSNPARRMVDEASRSVRGVPYDPSVKPKSSLQRQASMGRAYKEAVSDNPDYDRAIFERYGEVMPEVVEKSGAQNYDQLREAAYLSLSDEVKSQFDRLPVQTTYHSGDIEYPVPSAMMRDALGEGNLNVYAGGDPHEFLDRVDPQTGLSLNEMFRAVHDYAGHVAPGSTFRPGGEEIAYATHAQTMSPLAQMALLSETRGQNSLVNYSGLNADLIERMEVAKRQIKEHEIARGSSTPEVLRAAQDLPSPDELKAQLRELGSRWQYADQKAVLLPPEYLDPLSEGGTPDYLREVLRRPSAVSARGVHISKHPDLAGTDPSFYGTGHQGAEYARTRRNNGPDRTYFYSGPEGMVRPEDAVMGIDASGQMRRGDRFAYEAVLDDLYDLQQDPEGLLRLAQAYNLPSYTPTIPSYLKKAQALEGRSPIPDLERLVKDYGYSGYLTDRGGGQRWAAVYDPVEELRRIERGVNGYAEGGLVE